MTLPAFAVVPAMNAGAWFAQQQPPGGNVDGGGQGEDFGKSSPVGLLLLLLFLVAVAFLVRSMTKHLKRIPAGFDEPVESDSTGAPSDSRTAAMTTSLRRRGRPETERANVAEVDQRSCRWGHGPVVGSAVVTADRRRRTGRSVAPGSRRRAVRGPSRGLVRPSARTVGRAAHRHGHGRPTGPARWPASINSA